MTERRLILQESLAAIERLEARLRAAEGARNAPLAIVGAGCRYPGGIEDPEGLWRVVRDGVDAVAEVPGDRWDIDAYYSPDPKAPGKMITRRGGFLANIDRFEPGYFGISPREAAAMDPQQRLLLEAATEALQSAGIATDRLSGSATGVFVGITTSDYAQLLRRGGPAHSDVYSATGGALNAAAGRVAFTFGLQGPCVALDTACSSSLVAVHLACQSLRAGESDLALACGVNAVLSPEAMILFSKWGMMAPDGRCKTFDAAADGFVRSEGCAVIALKRLADALANRDPILALIRGSGVNSDGRSSGLTVPNGLAQQAVVRKALACAQLEPADIDYVEAHGTGTSLGDPIEVEAIGAVMREGRSPERPLLIGSIKTNIGHAEAASGIAGLLKVAMALRHEAIPPHLHFSQPNPAIPWGELPVRVPTTTVPWPRSTRPRRAGVSAFGFSGTNAHVVLEEAPLRTSAVETSTATVVPFSARSEAALREIARRTADWLARDGDASLADVALTAGTGRAHLAQRLAIVADSKASLERDLRSFADGARPPGAAEGYLRTGEQPRIAFLFTGQGAQYAGMGRGLYEREPAFRAALDRAAAVLAPRLNRPLLEVLFPVEGTPTPLGETAYTQPALFALEYALAEQWRAWGVTPSLVLGHSVGEYVAACVAGMMSLEDGLALIADRGALMQALPPGGGMAAIFAPEEWVAQRVADYPGRLAIAAVNGPEESVVSGDQADLSRLLARCSADRVQVRALDVSHAFHSPLLDPMLDAFERRARPVAFAPPRIPLVSNLTGALFPAGDRPDARYWRRHAREPVRFAACVDALRAAGATALVEVGPHPTLLGLAARAAPGAPWITVSSLRRGRDDWRGMLSALGALYACGAPVAWEVVDAGRATRRVSLPTYPFQRERHWAAVAETRDDGPGHPLLGEHRELASAPGTHVWETEIGLDTHPWLRDHRVQGAAVVPATAYLEMCLAAGGEVFGGGALSVQQVRNVKPLLLREGVRRRVQATLVVEPGAAAQFSVHSRNAGSPWTVHVEARVCLDEGAPDPSDGESLAALEVVRARCPRLLDGRDFYAALARKGNTWGPAFQGLEQVWLGEREAVGRVRLVRALVEGAARYRFHPALADACGHALVATVSLDAQEGATAGAFVGGGAGEIRFRRSPTSTSLWAHARLRPPAPGDERVVTGDVRVYDASGALVSEILEARLWYLDDAAGGEVLGAPDDWFYELRWRQQDLGGPQLRAARASGTWIALADAGGLAEALAGRRGAGGRTVLVHPGDRWSMDGDRATVRPTATEDLRRLFEEIPDATALLDLRAVGASDVEGGDLAAGPERLVSLLQGLVATEGRARPRLWVVTEDAQPVVPGDRCGAPLGAALWGLGRALSMEHAEIWGGLVDLAPGMAPERAAEHLFREVEAGTPEDQVAWRGGRRYVARLERWHRPPTPPRARAARPDGTYLVTGGLGGIGLAMARWLVERGARHLLLLGRTALPPRASWANLVDPEGSAVPRVAAVMALEAVGARVETAAVDVTVAGALERCLEARRDRGEPPVCGVIHAAGIVQFQPLATHDLAAVRAAVAAKLDGAWHLHRLFADTGLDCFILCSSSSALLRSPLLGVYAAGNAFLDALAHHRRAQGLPALSVNWGSWGEVGMAVDARRTRGSDMLAGVETLSTTRGLAALRELVEADAVQAAVMPVDWVELARAYPAFASDPFLSSVSARAERAAQPETGGGAPLAALRSATGAERGELVRAYLRAEIARTLAMTVDALDPSVPLSTLGFDSLMAVQVKNQIENDLGAVVPMIQLLQGPSVNELAPSVIASAESAPARSQPVTQPRGVSDWDEGSI